jgi:YVTN family beta-propeller protein
MRKIIFSIISLLLYWDLSAQQNFHISASFPIKSSGGWDYLSLEPGTNKLYVSHGTQVNILDENTGDSLGVIEGTTGVHGIAFDKAHGKGFTSNGRLNNVSVFDLATYKVLAQVPTGQNPDAIMYEPFTKRIITCNGRGKNLSIIDPGSNLTTDSIDLGGKPETAVSDGKGKLYVNIEDKNEIAVIDLQSFKVTERWPVGPGEEPTGLSFDKVTNRLFAACGNKYLIVLDASSGKIAASLPIGDGCDGVAFDANTKNIFTSNGEGTITIYHEKDNGDLELTGTVPTKRGARTITLNDKTHRIYLPTADIETGTEPGTRPKMIPGSFQVLVVSQ